MKVETKDKKYHLMTSNKHSMISLNGLNQMPHLITLHNLKITREIKNQKLIHSLRNMEQMVALH